MIEKTERRIRQTAVFWLNFTELILGLNDEINGFRDSISNVIVQYPGVEPAVILLSSVYSFTVLMRCDRSVCS